MTEHWPPWSTDTFLEALRDVYFPRARIAVVECGGVRVRTLLRGNDNALSEFYPFAFYLEPLPFPDWEPAVSVPYLAEVVTRITPAGEAGPPGATPAPYVDWSGFESFDQYLESREPPPGLDSPTTITRKARKLAKALGDLELRLIDDDPEVFETLLHWKHEQYLRTAGQSRLSVRQNLEFYHELRRRGVFTATSLRAGGRLIGGKIGYRTGGRHLSRVTAYHRELASYSPGAVLQMETLRASFEAGDREFDTLMGDERYKFTWVTHVRWLSTFGRQPLRLQVERKARAALGNALARNGRYATLKDFAQRTSSIRRR